MKAAYTLVFALLCSSLTATAARDYANSIVRVSVTAQGWDFHRPWQKGKPGSRQSFGVLLKDNQILVQSNVIADATFIELERIGSGEKAQARVKIVDYVANLALLEPEDPAFLSGMKAVAIAKNIDLDDSCEAVQFESNDEIDVSEGVLKKAETRPYPVGIAAFLVYRFKVDLGQNFGGRMVPFFSRGRLAGLGTSYSTTEKMANAIPVPVIRHFLEDVADGEYRGFPRAGFGFDSVEDPALRRYVGLDDDDSGIYVVTVQPGTAADEAGLKVDDVITHIDGYNVDKRGEYVDPDYGKISLSHLISTRHAAGETVDFRVIRNREEVTIPVTLAARNPNTWPVEPFIFDTPPKFMIVGGFVIQELTHPFLRAWGSDWANKAPRHLARLVREQWDLAKPGEKFIILTNVMPTRVTVGYEDVRFEQITAINGKEVKAIADVATALKEAKGDFHEFRFADANPGKLYLHAPTVPQVNQAIQRMYGLPLMERL